jgi:hypothetical protein
MALPQILDAGNVFHGRFSGPTLYLYFVRWLSSTMADASATSPQRRLFEVSALQAATEYQKLQIEKRH